MEVSNIIKIIIASIGTFISALVGGLGLAFTVLLGMMAIDVITGVMAGGHNGELTSGKSFRGLAKKVYIILLIGAVYLIQLAIPAAEFAADGITIAFIITEFISIVENGDRLGVPLPDKISHWVKSVSGPNKNKEEQ